MCTNVIKFSCIGSKLTDWEHYQAKAALIDIYT